MQRFVWKKEKQPAYRHIASACLFVLILSFFLHGITTISESTRARQRETLEQALSHCIMSCYSTEGIYPESLEYLKEHYGLTYNEEVFYVDYRITAGNLMPDLTIIEKED